MMVNCPRCGFSQPQDQYCARCGIDMLAFKPAPKPLFRRIASSTIFQVSAVVALVVTVFIFVRQERRRELAERVAEIENARNSQIIGSRASSSASKSELSSEAESSSASKQAEPPSPATSQAVNERSAPMPAPPSRPPASEPSASAGFVAPNANEDKSASASARQAHPAANVFVTFAAIPRAAVSDLVASADPGSGNLQGPILSGIVPGLGARVKSLQGSAVESLDSSSHSIKPAQPSEFYGGQRDESTGQFLGFVVEVIPTKLDENESHLQLRVYRTLRESTGQPEEVSIPLPDSYVVPQGAGIFITGTHLLPRRTLNEQERRFYDPMKVLHLLATEEFKQGLTDLVIFIEPK